jgi:YHS domain-containing protein
LAAVKCPVCKTCEIESERATYTARLGRVTYYFCEQRCRSQFLEEPDRYLAESSR